MSARVLDHLSLLASVQESFATELEAALPAQPVPSCGTWTATELGLHLAGIHRWAADIVGGIVVPDQDPSEPREPGALLAEYRSAASHLLSVLHDADPEAQCATLIGPGVVAFWHRRQLHETVIHLADLTLPHGRVPELPPEVWADTVDEVVTVMAPRQVGLGRTAPLAGVVRLVATDDASWDLGDAMSGGTEVPPAAVITAPASVLALLLWHRLTLDDPRVDVSGDAAVAAAVVAAALTP